MIKLAINNEPWGPWGSQDDSKASDETIKEEKNKKEKETEFDDFVKKSEDVLKNFFKSSKKSGGGKNNPPKNSQNFNDGSKTPKSVIGLVILGFILAWLLSRFYKLIRMKMR